MIDESFNDVMGRLHERDDAAAAAVFQRFARRLVALASTRLDRQVRQKVGAEDVVQSVFRSFFTRYPQGELDFGGWDGLWAFLVLVTVRKCGRAAEHFLAQRRTVRREVPLQPGPDSLGAPNDAVDGEPSPAEAAMLAESIAELMDGLPDDDRAIVALRLQNYTVPEISDRVGRTERTVHRVLARVRTKLEAQLAAAGA